MYYGSRVNGLLKPVPEELGLGYTQPGEIFELQMETGGIPDETAAITQLLQLEQSTPDMQILYIETNQQTGTITMQFMDKGPGAIILSGLLTSIPTFLIIGAIVIVGYFLWSVTQPTTTNQWLLLGLAAAGVGLVLFMAFYQKLPPVGKVWEKTPKEPRATPTVRYREEQINIRTRLKEIDREIARIDEQIKERKKTIETLPKRKTQATQQVNVVLRSNIEELENKRDGLEAKRESLSAQRD